MPSVTLYLPYDYSIPKEDIVSVLVYGSGSYTVTPTILEKEFLRKPYIDLNFVVEYTDGRKEKSLFVLDDRGFDILTMDD